MNNSLMDYLYIINILYINNISYIINILYITESKLGEKITII